MKLRERIFDIIEKDSHHSIASKVYIIAFRSGHHRLAFGCHHG